jgi:hypothetical protein
VHLDHLSSFDLLRYLQCEKDKTSVCGQEDDATMSMGVLYKETVGPVWCYLSFDCTLVVHLASTYIFPNMANDISHPDMSDSDRSDALKKSEVAQFEHALTSEDHNSFDAKATKRLLRKMDIRLIPFLALLYLLSFLDRYVSSSWNDPATATSGTPLGNLCTDADDCSALISATLVWLVWKATSTCAACSTM